MTLLDRTELEKLIDLTLDSGLSTSSFVRQLILREYRNEYMNKK